MKKIKSLKKIAEFVQENPEVLKKYIDKSGANVTEIDPSAVKKALRRLKGEADEIIPEVPISTPEVVQTPNKINKLFPMALGAGAAGGAGGLYLSSDETEADVPESPQIPLAPSSKEKKQQEIVKEPMQQVAKTIEVQPKPTPKETTEVPVSNENNEPTEGYSQDPLSNYSDMLLRAQNADADMDFRNTLLRAGVQAGAALARVNPDYSGVQALEKNQGFATRQIKNLMDTKAAEQQMRKSQNALEAEKSSNDPNSPISKQFTEKLKKFGINVPEGYSASQLEAATGLKMSTILGYEENRRANELAAQTRKEMAEAEARAMAERMGETNKFKAQTSVDRLINNARNSDAFKAFNLANDASSLLDEARAGGDKTAAGSAFMSFAKVAQNDPSVVRREDMRVLAGGWNYTSPSQMFGKLMAKARGGDFNDKELEQMKKVVEHIRELKREQVGTMLNPALERMKSNDLNIAEHIDPSLVEQFKQNPEMSEAPISMPNAKQEAMIKQLQGNNPGLTRDRAIQALRNKGYIQ